MQGLQHAGARTISHAQVSMCIYIYTYIYNTYMYISLSKWNGACNEFSFDFFYYISMYLIFYFAVFVCYFYFFSIVLLCNWQANLNCGDIFWISRRLEATTVAAPKLTAGRGWRCVEGLMHKRYKNHIKCKSNNICDENVCHLPYSILPQIVMLPPAACNLRFLNLKTFK